MTITTDESGHASTGSDVLPYGTYEIRESATNESMLLTWQGETVTVRQNGHSVAITAVNDVERGGLSVEKQDTITGSTPQGDADFEGITFQIINNSRNPVMVEGQKYQPGEVVKTLVTDAEGKASTAHDLLPYGEYILHESTTNESMLLTAPDQTVLVEDDGVMYEFTMADEVVRGGVLIEKRDLESGLLTPLGGASLDGTAEPTGEITIVDVVEYTGLIPDGTYTISGVLMDKATGEPLLLDGAIVTAEVEFTPEASDGTVELTYTLDAGLFAGTSIVVFETLYKDGVEIAAHADINDEAQTVTINPRGGLLIQKTSEDGVLEGFTFLVEGEGYSETFITDGAGKIYIEDLAPGEYTVTEQESELTARYEIPTGQTVTVTADEATTVEFYNRLLRGKITGHKTGAEQAPLEGVTFGLFDAEVTEFTEETAIEVTSSNEAGEFTFEAPYGNYQVAELETVPGYVTMKESIAVELDKTDVDLEDIANSQTVVHFSKVDAETGEELPGAVLELYAPDGSLLDTWETTEIPHVIPGLPVGEGYVLREVTAPEGFEVAEDVTFNVEDTTEIQTITMEDEKTPDQPEEPETPDEPEEPDEPTPDIPQTGGSRAVIWVSGLLILALLGLCITVPLLRHINKQ